MALQSMRCWYATFFRFNTSFMNCSDKNRQIPEIRPSRFGYRGGNGSDFNGAHALLTYSAPGTGTEKVFLSKFHTHCGELEMIPPLTPLQLPKPMKGPVCTRHWQVRGFSGFAGFGFSAQGAPSQMAQ